MGQCEKACSEHRDIDNNKMSFNRTSAFKTFIDRHKYSDSIIDNLLQSIECSREIMSDLGIHENVDYRCFINKIEFNRENGKLAFINDVSAYLLNVLEHTRDAKKNT